MKRVCALLLTVIMVLAMIVPCTASAAEARAMSIVPGLSFSGTTAYCEVVINCDYSTDEITATMRLWEGNFCIATWSDSGEGVLYIDGSKAVTKGNTYSLTVDATINGVQKPRVLIERTC